MLFSCVTCSLDPQFPPDSTSLFRDLNNKRFPQLEEHIWKWKRLSEFFNDTAYMQITMVEDAKKLICSIAIKSAAEAESMQQVVRLTPSNSIDRSFVDIATNAVQSGLAKRKREHLLLCTTNMITHLSEYVENGLMRFDLLWQKSLLEHYRPLSFVGLGTPVVYRVEGETSELRKVCARTHPLSIGHNLSVGSIA